MKQYNWNDQKSIWLKKHRGISFEESVLYLENEKTLLDNIQHPDQLKYHGQRMFLVLIDDYVYLIPYIENDKEIFLKTIIPSRKATKIYLGGRDEK